jgi:hypothetical protein
MRALTHSGRAARLWHRLFVVRWQQWHSRLGGVYHRRVTEPVRFWQSMGSPFMLRPSVPWWQPILYIWLRVAGAAPRRTRREWRRFRRERAAQRLERMQRGR